MVSGRTDRVDPQPIENVQLAEDVFIFMDLSRSVRKVSYYLDDPPADSRVVEVKGNEVQGATTEKLYTVAA